MPSNGKINREISLETKKIILDYSAISVFLYGDFLNVVDAAQGRKQGTPSEDKSSCETS